MGFNKGERVFFAFKDGKTVADSQRRPRMYKTIEQAKKTYPGWIHGEAELVEYAPVVHGRWKPGSVCSVCDMQALDWYKFCPNCGARMDGGADDDG